jgi:hypothetical protein
MKRYYPVTPAGTLVDWLGGNTKKEAIRRLLIDAAHMPYNGWKEFHNRGYRIKVVEE